MILSDTEIKLDLLNNQAIAKTNVFIIPDKAVDRYAVQDERRNVFPREQSAEV